jgi:tetratricopeptide (TPR) repeat protein
MCRLPTNRHQIMRRIVMVCVLGVLGLGCRDLTSAELPAGTKNPKEYATRDGAIALYRGAIGTFTDALVDYLNAPSVLTDEYLAVGPVPDSVDLRRLPAELGSGVTYARLHTARGQIQQALGALTHYAPDVSPALRGHLFALQAYAELFLADLFCSGIPLSTLEFGGDFTYHPSSPTTEVYAHALTLFDSALAFSSDSVRIEYLARIGKARALLQLSKYAEAAEVVEAVPPPYRYAEWEIVVPAGFLGNLSVAHGEGGTGLPYRTDPRVDAVFLGNYPSSTRPIYQPQKYLPAGSVQPIVMASGVEAQLIQAEADLHAGNIAAWLNRLNALRTDGTFTVDGTDTVWGVGLGAALFAETPTVAAVQRGLPPLTDPALGGIPPGKDSTAVRVDLLFAERGYWLFRTGHRQGDLRRLVREYGRPQETVYPSQGVSLQGGTYGRDVTFPITMQMEGANPFFKGCLHRDA